MSGNLATYLAAGAALGAASEATGTTAITPLGQQAREEGDRSGGGGGSRPPIDLSSGQGAGTAEAVQAVADAFSQSVQNAPAAEAARSSRDATSGVAQQAAMLEASRWRQRVNDLEEKVSETKEAVEEKANETKENVEEKKDRATDYSGLGVNVDLGGDGGSDGSSESLLDKTERAGGQVEGSVGFVAEGANTLRKSAEALAGEEYTTENTYFDRFGFEEGSPTATKKIDYPDVPDVPSSEEIQKNTREEIGKQMKRQADPLGIGEEAAEKGKEWLESGGIL